MTHLTLQSQYHLAQRKRLLSTTLYTSLFLGAALLLSACSVTPKPLTMAEQTERMTGDISALFADQEPVTAPISLEEAMARAIKYNMDHRLKLMENALASHQLTSANLSMLPSLTATAGYTGRDNFAGSNSNSLTNGVESLESSTSSDRDSKTFDLSLTWNVLDLGMSWVRANQEADRLLVTEERRRKVVHNIIQDVRSAYWNALSADHLLAKIGPLSQRVITALENARKAQKAGTEAPLAALRYRRELLDTLRQLKILRRELNSSKTQLAALMNLKPGTPYTIAAPDKAVTAPKFTVDVSHLESLALLHRPELREETYQGRISHNDVKLAYMDMIPGLELNTAWNGDSNSYAWEQTWFSWGSSITANLFDVFTGPQKIDAAKARTDVVKTRRLALSMAVMSQVHVSIAEYNQAIGEFETSNEIHEVERDILTKVNADVSAGSGGERTSIRAELESLLAELRRDLAVSRVRNAVGRIFVSVGADPLPKSVEGHDLTTLSNALKEVNEKWFNGTFDLPGPTARAPEPKTEDGNAMAAAQPTTERAAQQNAQQSSGLMGWFRSLFKTKDTLSKADTPPA